MTERVKVFCCQSCKYTTLRKYNLIRHHDKVHSVNKIKNEICEKKVGEIEIKVGDFNQKVGEIEIEVGDFNQKVGILHNVVGENEKKLIKEFNCEKCKKVYKTEKSYVKHISVCKGIDILTCPKCMKKFADKFSKCKHIKNNKCKPRSIIHAEQPSNNFQTLNNIQTQNNNSIQTQNNIQNSVINNIYINNYGNERIDYLTNDELNKILMAGTNTIPLMIEKKHFNSEFPENQNINYTIDNRTLVKENNEWKEKNLKCFSSKLIQDNTSKLIKYLNANIEEIDKYIKNDEIFEHVRKKLNIISLKTDMVKYKDVFEKVKDLIKNNKLSSQTI